MGRHHEDQTSQADTTASLTAYTGKKADCHLPEVGHLGKGWWASSSSSSISAAIPTLLINRRLHSHIAAVALQIHLRHQLHHQ